MLFIVWPDIGIEIRKNNTTSFMRRTLYVFYCSANETLYGLTLNANGTNLPELKSGTWIFKRRYLLAPTDPAFPSGVTPKEILSAVDNTGFFVRDIKMRFSEWVGGYTVRV